MEKRIATQDLQVGNQTYRFNKMNPRVACWLFSMLGSRAAAGGSLLSAIGRLAHAEFDEVQTSALSCVFRVDNDGGVESAMPVMVGSMIADPQAADDASILFKLTGESIKFSLDPFIAGGE